MLVEKATEALNREIEEVEEFYDPKTGELLTDPGPDIEAKVLPRLLERVAAVQRDIDHIDAYMKMKIETCTLRVTMLKDIQARSMSQAEAIMQRFSYKKKLYPGLGTLLLKATQPKLISDEYALMNEADQKMVQTTYDNWFQTTIKVNPIAKEIKLSLADGKTIPGFRLRDPQAYAFFKQEDTGKSHNSL